MSELIENSVEAKADGHRCEDCRHYQPDNRYWHPGYCFLQMPPKQRGGDELACHRFTARDS